MLNRGRARPSGLISAEAIHQPRGLGIGGKKLSILTAVGLSAKGKGKVVKAVWKARLTLSRISLRVRTGASIPVRAVPSASASATPG